MYLNNPTRNMKRKGSDLPPASRKVARHSPSLGTEKPRLPPKTMAYPDGGLRITRTPGRCKEKNCIGLGDIIDKDHLVSACLFAFYIAEEEFFPYLPISNGSTDAIPIYIGRDVNNDPLLESAASRASISLGEGKVSKKTLEVLRPHLEALHQTTTTHPSPGRSGSNTTTTKNNLHPFYAWSTGSSHSKILLLVYPTFFRIVITSCNLMDTDTVLGDNHWYLHDVPQRTAGRVDRAPVGFEETLLAHLEALGTPAAFLGSVRGLYDYAAVKVHLVTSHPGTFSGLKAEQHGLLRLRKVVRHLGLDLGAKPDEEVRIEVCTASVGNISARWLNGFHKCATGQQEIGVYGEDDEKEVPDIRLFYPSVSDVRNATADSQDGASNIGCHLRPWNKAPQAIKELFHHYRSKDTGRLFHQKLIMAYDPSQPDDDMPYYIYVGSANLSQSAWGAVAEDKSKKGNDATCHTKLAGVSNFECGVVIPGQLIMGLLEPGTETWGDGVVPYEQTAAAYDLKKDKPWNDPRWVKGYRDGIDNLE
ncbi:tyrosyl-DNA phosphodiesterase-domain-containing protein [Apiospora arundinis]|uniref:Tyrosyl-DNA phosphodiesterase-domain-containing protein n=1 Tax=Apiospora arundinis TaxID=335852 RepID=A0ABR2IRR7_9PEZI